jgi:RNA polymerase sigma-54 factor
MELLYMPLLDLQQHLKEELAENPFLEMTEADTQQEVELKEDVKDEPLGDDVDWEEILLDGFDVGGRKEQYEHKEFFEPTPVESRDLHDHLNEQLRLLPLPERQLRLGEEIIGDIDDNGTLSCSLEEVLAGVNGWLEQVRPVAVETAEDIEDAEERAAELQEIEEVFRAYDLAEAENMLRVIQGFDPPGVGARDVRESILIQLKQKGDRDTVTTTIVEEHFDALINHRWNDIARTLGITAKEVQDAADEISHLDPKPGLKYSADPEHYVIPDLIVEKIGEDYLVFANDTSLPRLRISQAYREVAKDKSQFTGGTSSPASSTRRTG